MCGKAYDPRFVFAWPTARYADDERAPQRIRWLRFALGRWSGAGKVLSEAEKTALYEEIRAAYDEQADPRYGAARLWIDAIIDPAKTREVLMAALEACGLIP